MEHLKTSSIENRAQRIRANTFVRLTLRSPLLYSNFTVGEGRMPGRLTFFDLAVNPICHGLNAPRSSLIIVSDNPDSDEKLECIKAMGASLTL
jgi:hypothetical protein